MYHPAAMPGAPDIARRLPDVPRFVETRAMLMSDECEIMGDLDSGLIAISRRTFLSAVIGRPIRDAMEHALRAFPSHVELLVEPENVEDVRPFLAGWQEHPATIHAQRESIPGVTHQFQQDVVLFDRVNDEARSRFTDKTLRREVAHATAIAARQVEGHFVSICYTNYIGETLWDVGVDTLPQHRRHGYARDCYVALAQHLASKGKQPVWGALDTNEPSMRMAASLGFEPVDRLHIFVPPKNSPQRVIC